MPNIYKGDFINLEMDEEEEETVLIPGFPMDDVAAQESDLDEIEQDGVEFSSQPKEILYNEQEIQRRVEEELERVRESVKAQAREEAYRDAVLEKQAEIHSYFDKLDAVVQEMEQQQTDFVMEFKDHVVSMALSIAEKIMIQKISEDDMFLSELVTAAIASVKNAQWITVQVSDKMNQLIEYLNEQVKNAQEMSQVEIVAGPYPPDTCIVEFPDGFVDASVSEQMKNLKKQIDTVN